MTDDRLRRTLLARPDTQDATIDPRASQALEDLVARFLPTTADAADRLAEQVADYLVQKRAVGEDTPVDPAFVARVLAIHTGLARPLVDPGTTPAVEDVAAELQSRGAPPVAAQGLAEALLDLRSRVAGASRPLLAVEIVGDDVAGRRAAVRALAAWALGSPLRVIRATTDQLPMVPDSAARTLHVRPLQVVRLDDLHGHDAVRTALVDGTLPDGVDLRGALVVRTASVALGPLPGVRTIALPAPAHGLRLVQGESHAPASEPPAPPVDDVLLRLEPVEGPDTARDHVAQVYRRWADAQGHGVAVLHEPLQPHEPCMLRLSGEGLASLLQGESGLHRVRHEGRTSVIRVRVAPVDRRIRPVVVTDMTALKTAGAWGGKVRSRVACDGGLILQNERGIADNRHLAIELADAFGRLPRQVDHVVRRIDLDAPHMHDDGTGTSTSDPDALSPAGLQALLVARTATRPDDGGVA